MLNFCDFILVFVLTKKRHFISVVTEYLSLLLGTVNAREGEGWASH